MKECDSHGTATGNLDAKCLLIYVVPKLNKMDLIEEYETSIGIWTDSIACIYAIQALPCHNVGAEMSALIMSAN